MLGCPQSLPQTDKNEDGPSDKLQQFSCSVSGCQKRFSSKKTLQEHLRTHTGERPFFCAICEATFT